MEEDDEREDEDGTQRSATPLAWVPGSPAPSPPPWPARTPTSAPRSGLPWGDADYQQILDAARSGERDIEEVARRLGRAANPTMGKAKQLLPLAQRGVPFDRVLPLLQEYQEQPDYDWRQVMLEQPPPRPVINPPALSGLRGLEPEDLLLLGYAVGVAASALEEDIVTRMGDELERRGLLADLERYRVERLVRQPGSEATWSEALAEAQLWLRRVFPESRRGLSHWGHQGWDPY